MWAGLAKWTAVALVGVAFFVAMIWLAVATSDVPAECQPEHPGPTPASCSGGSPPWQDSGDAPERGGPGHLGP